MALRITIILLDSVLKLTIFVRKHALKPVLINALSLVGLLLMHLAVFGQEDSIASQLSHDSTEIKYDSATQKIFKSAKQLGAAMRQRNLREYDEDTIATKQDEIIEKIRTLTIEGKSYLENGLDTTGLTAELGKIEHWYDITSDGVFTNIGTLQTNRNLETSHKIMKELLTRILTRKSSLDGHYKNLTRLRNTIDSLYNEKVLYKLSSDSAVLMRYVKKLVVVEDEINPIDSSFKTTLALVSDLQTTVNRFVNRLNASIGQIEIYQSQLSSKTFSRESANLGGAVTYKRSFSAIIAVSIKKGILAFIFYVQNETVKIAFVLSLVFLTAIFLLNLRRSLHSQDLLKEHRQAQLVLKYPAMTAIIIILNLMQFIFSDLPFVFSAIIWTTSGIFLTIIFKNFATRYWWTAWLIMFVLFVLAVADNLILQASRIERWIMLILSVAGIICGSLILLMGRRHELKQKPVIYFVAFVVIMQIVSMFANIYGRYNLAKTCLTSGFFNLVIATLFLWTLRFSSEVLSLAITAYNIGAKKLFYFNFNRLSGRPHPIFYVLLIVGWFVLFSRNFYIHNVFAEPIIDFIVQKRIVGEFSFSIGSVLSFFLILYLSALISRIVSFFASERYSDSTVGKQRKGVGSWLLIIRISIVSIGLLLAFAALGIPMNRITIILSALGVGIGFGLQTLVNNLVSGLIISFEKPVNVGDVVEIGGRSGTIKSIGFRSSIISIGNGSQVVIPNGDLLNQQLVNWTHDNNNRSVDIPLSVSAGINLAMAIQVLKSLPVNDERVLPEPEPVVVVKQFSTTSIDLLLSFWVREMSESDAVKTSILVALDTAFKEHKIATPVS